MQESKKLRKPKVAAEQKDVYDLVAKGVEGRYGLALTGDDVTSLWLLCKNVITLSNPPHQSISFVFSPI